MNSLIQKDLNHIWHPCAQMKEFETCPPLVIYKGKGSYLDTDQGRLIDGISSWWCKALGHAHPFIQDAIKNQMALFEHVIAANTTHPILAEFGEKIAQISQKQHVFFACDGSSAVEIAMKLAMHAKQIQGQAEKNEFISLSNSYHGETLATISVGDLGIYKKPYEGYGVQCHFLTDLPYVCSETDPLWEDCSPVWDTLLNQLEKAKAKACAVIVEPLVQGSAGMLCYSADFLKKLAFWAKQNDIYLIADEIMTGIGRTGEWLACQKADVHPDLICLSKGLTGGMLPMSCVLIDHPIFNLFYGDYSEGNSFLHSHTHSANALAVSAALATIQIIEKENILEKAKRLGHLMHEQMTNIAKLTGKLVKVRTMGAIVAADLLPWENKRLGHEFYRKAIKNGALLRPIGHTIYWLPPLNTEEDTIMQLAEITLNSINEIYK